uniref:50S ribosomal protein L21, chloroplastic n=1 Tax=Palmaria palmata TaxID=2822 RepID=A0A1C9CH74_PALPL|nr:ribosomal protein L21 [Palmaria palmata]AOM67748.1 ribosomal protein L21 [Palmaria palmata]
MIYAILEASGKQLWVQPGRFYDINKIAVKPGQHIKLEKILFFKKHAEVRIGTPCIPNMYATGKVLRHIKGSKITVFKMKSKKNMRIKNGHRQELSRVLIESVNIK